MGSALVGSFHYAGRPLEDLVTLVMCRSLFWRSTMRDLLDSHLITASITALQWYLFRSEKEVWSGRP